MRVFTKKRGIFATIIVIFVIVIVSLFNQTTYGVLYTDMNAMNLGNLHTFIQDMGVPVKVEGTNILIPKNRFTEIKVALAAQGISYDYNSSNSSRENYPDVEDATIVEQGNLDIREINYSKVEFATNAKQVELESSLLNFDKIDGAKIALDSDNEINSASIVLTTNEVISDTEIDKIVLFVSKSIENLDKENIQIADQDANMIYPKN